MEFVHEDAAAVGAVLARLARAHSTPGTSTPAALEARLRAAAPEGVTEGSYFVPHEGLRALPML